MNKLGMSRSNICEPLLCTSIVALFAVSSRREMFAGRDTYTLYVNLAYTVFVVTIFNNAASHMNTRF